MWFPPLSKSPNYAYGGWVMDFAFPKAFIYCFISKSRVEVERTLLLSSLVLGWGQRTVWKCEAASAFHVKKHLERCQKMFLNKSTKYFYAPALKMLKSPNIDVTMVKNIWWVKPRLLGESCAMFILVESKENGNQTSKDKKLGQQDFGKKHLIWIKLKINKENTACYTSSITIDTTNFNTTKNVSSWIFCLLRWKKSNSHMKK